MVRPFPVISFSFLAVLLGLLSVDLAFVLVNIFAFFAERLELISKIPDFVKITRDQALPEVFGYIEWAAVILSLLWLSVRERWQAPLRWAIVFVIILIDDAIQIHESVGLILTEYLHLPVSLQAQNQDVAELMVFGVMGLIALALTASLFASRDHYTRAISKRFGLIILFLAFFGVILDFVHQTITNFSSGTMSARFLPQIFAMIEDGGELVVASYAAAFALTLPGLEPLSSNSKPPKADISPGSAGSGLPGSHQS